MKEVLITSSVLIVVLLILRAFFATKVRRTLIYGVWLLVALRLLLPFQIGALSFSVLNLLQPVNQTITEISDKQVAGVTEQDAYRQVMQDYIEQDQTVFLPEVQEQIQSALQAQMPKEEISSMLDKTLPEEEIYVPAVRPQVQEKVEKTVAPITLGQILWSIWGVGALAVALWLAISNLRFVRHMKKSATAVDTDSPIPVYVTKNAVSPCLVGLFRPAIYLTEEAASNERLRRYVMTHELTHYAHKDHIWATARCLCLCLYWFNPLVWVAAWCSRRDCELACDEGAMARLGEEERIPYGKALLAVVEEASVPSRLMLTATTMAETKSQLRRRVSFIARKPHLSLFAAIALVLVCSLTVGCVATGARPQPISEDPIIIEPTESTAPTEGDTNAPSVAPTDAPSENTLSPDPSQAATAPTPESPSAATGESTRPSVNILPNETTNSPATARPTNSINPPATTSPVVDPTATTTPVVDPTATTTPGFTTQMPPATTATTATSVSTESTRPTSTPSATPTEATVYGDITYSLNRDGKTCTVLHGASSIQDAVIPDTINGYKVTAIAAEAFFNCYSLKTIVIPESVTTIGAKAFSGCIGLTEFTLPQGLTAIPDYLFSHCRRLKTVVIPESVTSIGAGAFSSCTRLTELTLPQGLTAIADYLFSDCDNLETVVIPESVTSIGKRAFNGCGKLTELTLPQGLTTIAEGAFRYTGLQRIVIPQAVTVIEEQTFTSCRSLTEVAIPDGVTDIKTRAFDSCVSLESIRLPKELDYIGANAFDLCSALKAVYYNGTTAQWNFVKKVCKWPANIRIQCTDGQVDPTAPTAAPTIKPFTGTTSASTAEPPYYYGPTLPLTNPTVQPTVSPYDSFIASDINYRPNSDGKTCTVLGCDQYITHLSIPGTVNGYTVTAIADNAFYGHTSLQQFSCEENLIYVGYAAFQDCTNLYSVRLPDSVTQISGRAFAGCESLKNIQLPEKLKTIANAAFTESGLVQITVPGGVTEISDYAFAKCHRLQTVQLPDTLTKIGYHAFFACNKLRSLQLPESMTQIGENAFAECDSLKEVRIPSGVTALSQCLFYYCDTLERVYIPTTVTKLEMYALYDCPALTTLCYDGTVAQWKTIDASGSWTNKSVTVQCTDGQLTVQ